MDTSGGERVGLDLLNEWSDSEELQLGDGEVSDRGLEEASIEISAWTKFGACWGKHIAR